MSIIIELSNIWHCINFAVLDGSVSTTGFTVSEKKYHEFYNYRLDKDSKAFRKDIIHFINPAYFTLKCKSEYNGYRDYTYTVKVAYLDFWSQFVNGNQSS